MFYIFDLFLNAFPDSAIFKHLLLFLCMKSYLRIEIEFNPEKSDFGKNDVFGHFNFHGMLFVRLF